MFVCQRTLTLVAAATVLAGVASAQVAEQHLAAADAVFPEPFTAIAGLRELTDGRVLIADRTERHVSYLDFIAGSIGRIGRVGDGPGEYQTPTALLPLPEDRSLLVDFGNLRMTQIDAQGRFGNSWPLLSDEGGFRQPVASDARGRLYYTSGMSFTSGAVIEFPDSNPVLRWDPSADVMDTVASLYAEPRVRGGAGALIGRGGSVRLRGFRSRPFRPQDGWAVTRDGTVLVARAEGYRVDAYREGAMTAGPAVAVDPIPIGRAEQEAWADAQEGRSATLVAVGGSGGRTGTSMRMPRPDLDEVDFPEFKPPFPSNGLSTTPDGELWVQRHRTHDARAPLFDVFNGRGELIKRVRLPEGRTLVGFGDGVVYAVMTDEDDLQWLERYRR